MGHWESLPYLLGEISGHVLLFVSNCFDDPGLLGWIRITHFCECSLLWTLLTTFKDIFIDALDSLGVKFRNIRHSFQIEIVLVRTFRVIRFAFLCRN